MGAGKQKEFYRALRVIGLAGFQLAAAMLVGFFVGRFLDQKLSSGPWFSALGFLWGLAVAFRRLWVFAQKEEQD